MERGRIGPTSDGEENLEMSVLLLEFIDCFEVAIEIVAGFIPGIAGVVYVFVRPSVGQEHFATVSSDIGKGVKNMSR